MPKRTTSDEEMPRRRRRAAAAAVGAETERGFAMRLLLRSPKDVVAGCLAFAATAAIVTNALFLQAGPHPAPMFGSFPVTITSTPAVISPLPRPRPAEADGAEPRIAEPRFAEPRLAEPRLAEPKPAEPRGADPLGSLVRSTAGNGAAATAGIVRPPAPIPLVSHNEVTSLVGSRRVAAVQRVLTQYGYGQLKPTGTMSADTEAAIERFERERRLPVTGQVSERLVREISAVVGHPIE